jgi:hypothetical protein
MSSINTEPKLQPTVTENLPLQVQINSETTQMINFGDVPPSILRPSHGLKVDQLNFQNFPEKDRILALNEWNKAGDIGEIWNFEINWFNIKDFLVVGNTSFRFSDITSVNFSIKTNTQNFFQGKIWLIYEPAPIHSYMEDVFNYIPTIYQKSQLQRLEITPQTDGEFNFTVPIFAPFEFFFTSLARDKDILDRQSTYFKEYLDFYSFGRFYAETVIPLESKNSTTTGLSYPISIKFSGVNFGGTTANFKFE